MSRHLFLVALAACAWLVEDRTLSGKEEEVAINQVPKAVMSAVRKRFPEAKITGAAQEQESDQREPVYELRLEDKLHNVDVSVSPAGDIQEIETAINEDELPRIVRRTMVEKFPNAKLKLVETVVLVKDGKEVLDCYELKVVQNKKVTEVKVAPDGKIKATENEDEPEEDENDQEE